MGPELHDDLRPLAFLLGTWRGEGAGEYPTIEPFAYREEMRFEHVGDTFLCYQQASWSPDDGGHRSTSSAASFDRGSRGVSSSRSRTPSG